MKVKRKYLYLKFLLIYMFIFPFQIQYLGLMNLTRKFFGEFASYSYFYFTFIIVAIIIFYDKNFILNIKIPKNYIKFLYLFILSVIISTLLNINNISISYFKGRAAIQKYTVQLVSFAFVFLFIIYLYKMLIYLRVNFTLRYLMIKIYRTWDYLIIFSIIFCLLEFINITFFDTNMPVISSIIKIFHSNEYYRVRFVTSEPSYFGAGYLLIVLPRILMRFEKKENKLLNIIMLIGITFSMLQTNSRMSYVLFCVYILIFLFLHLTNKKVKSDKKILFFIGMMMATLVFVMIYITFDIKIYELDKYVSTLKSLLNYGEIASNSTRYGLTNAAFEMGWSNIGGVGLGQFAFRLNEYFNTAKYMNAELQSYLNVTLETLFPIAHNLYVSFFAELGIIGLFSWVYLLGSIFIKLINYFKCRSSFNEEQMEILSYAIIYFVGIVLYGFTNSFISMFSILFAIAFCLFVIYELNSNQSSGQI